MGFVKEFVDLAFESSRNESGKDRTTEQDLTVGYS